MNQQNYEKIHRPVKYIPYEPMNITISAKPKWFKMPRIYKGSYSRFRK